MVYKNSNINYVFQSAGLWTESFPKIQHLLNIFKDVGILATIPNPNLMRCCETFRMEALSFSHSDWQKSIEETDGLC